MLRPHHCLQKSKCDFIYWTKTLWWGMVILWSCELLDPNRFLSSASPCHAHMSSTGRKTIPEIRSVLNKPSDAASPSNHGVIQGFDELDPCTHNLPQLELLGTAINPSDWCPRTQHLEKGIKRKEHTWNNPICIKHLSCNCTIPTCH